MLDIEDLVKWIHICCHLGYRNHFELLTSEVVRRATLEDVTEDFAPAYFNRLSETLQRPSTPTNTRSIVT